MVFITQQHACKVLCIHYRIRPAVQLIGSLKEPNENGVYLQATEMHAIQMCTCLEHALVEEIVEFRIIPNRSCHNIL